MANPRPRTSMSRWMNSRHATSAPAGECGCRGSEIQDQRHRAPRMGMATQFPGERDRGVHLADSAIQHRDSGPLEHPVRFRRQRHHHERAWKIGRHLIDDGRPQGRWRQRKSATIFRSSNAARATTSYPARTHKSAEAVIVPPVARTSSISNTRRGPAASRALPIRIQVRRRHRRRAAGACPCLRTSTKPLWRRAASAAPRMNPRDSMPASTSRSRHSAPSAARRARRGRRRSGRAAAARCRGTEFRTREVRHVADELPQVHRLHRPAPPPLVRSMKSATFACSAFKSGSCA